MEQNVQWFFEKQQRVEFGRALYVVGNIHELGCWDPNRGIRMNWNDDDQWSVTIKIPKENIQYKFFEGGYHNPYQGGVEWQHGKNRILKTQDLIEQQDISNITLLKQKQSLKNQSNQLYLNSLIKHITIDKPSLINFTNLNAKQNLQLINQFKKQYGYVSLEHYISHQKQSLILFLNSRKSLIDKGFTCINKELVHMNETDKYVLHCILKNHECQHSLIISIPSMQQTQQQLVINIVKQIIEKARNEDKSFRGNKLNNIFVVISNSGQHKYLYQMFQKLGFIRNEQSNIFYKGKMKVKKVDTINRTKQFKAIKLYFQ